MIKEHEKAMLDMLDKMDVVAFMTDKDGVVDVCNNRATSVKSHFRVSV